MESQVVEPRQDQFIPIEEYAVKYDVSRRTLDRYCQTGRIEKVKRKGKSYIIDIEPKPEVYATGHGGPSSESELAPLVRDDWIAFGAAQCFAKSRHKWQVFAIVQTVLIFMILIAGVGGGVYAWLTITSQKEALTDYTIRHSTLEAGLSEANTTIERNNALHSEEITRLQDRIDELMIVNSGLVEKVADLSIRTVEPSNEQPL